MRRIFSYLCWSFLCWSSALLVGFGPCAQAAAPPTQDPQALALVRQALAVLGGNTGFTDVSLEATLTYTAGSDIENGTATLQAKGNRENRVVLNLDGGERHEIRQGPVGIWSGPDSQAHPIATHNTWTEASWFFPALSLQAVLSDPQLVAAYVGLETHNGASVQHLRVSRLLPGQDSASTALIAQLSRVDIYLDAATALPLAMDFNVHPDNNAGLDIPVEIQFGDYRLVNNVKVPFHLQKFMQGTLMLDLHVSSAAVNSGVADSDFTVPGA